MKKLYTTLAGIFLISSSIFAQTLVASYPFNGNANEASGNGNNGTVNGATLTTDRFGNANSAYYFDGNNHYISCPNSSQLLDSKTFSVSLWFKVEKRSGSWEQNIIVANIGNYQASGGFQLVVPNPPGVESGMFRNQTYSDQNTIGNYTIQPDLWYNYVFIVRYDAIANMTHTYNYINGAVDDSALIQGSVSWDNIRPFYIGINLDGFNGYQRAFLGSIDDIKIYTGAFSDAQVSDSFSTQSLVASYPFNGNANDVSGNGNNGTVMGATLTTDRFGNANSAYLFNGTSNWIEVANSASLQLGNTFTISAWVNHNGFYNGNYQGNFYVSKGNDDNVTTGEFALASGETDGNPNPDPTGYKIFYFNNTLAPSTYAQVLSDSPAVKLNRWYNVVITANINTLKLYVNGKLMATNTNAGAINANNADNLFMGRQNKVGNEYWLNGVLDDVNIYNSELPATAIFDAYVNDLKKPGSGNAIQFTGTGSLSTSPYITIGSGFDFGTQPFTYETWVKRNVISTTINNSGKVLIVGNNFNSWGVGILNDNTLFFTKAGVNFVASTGTISDTKWHHVAVVYTGTQIQFYIDGIAAGSPSYTDNFSNTSGSYIIGSNSQSFGNSNGDQTLDGQLDETRIWRNVALTQTEIRDWMCKKITSAHPAYANLFSYYRLDEGGSDLTGGYDGKYGTLTNAPTWQTSGASLGDASAYDYINATKTVTLGAPTGETFTVTSTSGNPAGIQVYRVDTLPNTLTGTAGTGSNHKYFGVFQSAGTTPLYSAVYNYGGNAAISGNDPTGFRLYRRDNNADVLWTDAMATLNTTNKTLIVAGASTEYMLGSVLNPLPVTLISFSAIKNGSDVELNWQTTNEENLKNYVVEKSTNATTFSQLAVVNANDNAGINNYTATDMNPANGVNYYRLKQIDGDGKYTYSDIRSVNFSDNFKVFISPNPATNNIKIYTDQMLMSVQIMDASGKTIKWLIPTSNNLYDVSDLQKGIYFLRIATKTKTQTLRLAKQ